ncbi:MAG: twin-arginine translocase TatA/TatE family subunit [Gammaproteobacteria bacterium]|nr:twin-arginine translocase TatA/TatE family subunit [Gammaproteobacteria bacterium]
MIVLVLFGSKKLGNIGQDLGGAIKGFKRAMGDGESGKEDDDADRAEGRVIEGGKVDRAATAERDKSEV